MTKKYPNFAQELVDFVSMLKIMKQIHENPSDSLLHHNWQIIEESVKSHVKIVSSAAMKHFREEVYEAAEDYLKNLRESNET